MPPIVYFEDDPLSCQVMELMLKRMLNYTDVYIWQDSSNYLERLKALLELPELILMDIHMQPLTGFDLLAGLRQESTYETTKIVAITASVMNEEVDVLREAGFDGVIGKPLDMNTFPELLNRIMGGEKVWQPT